MRGMQEKHRDTRWDTSGRGPGWDGTRGCQVRLKWTWMWLGHVYEGRDTSTMPVTHVRGAGRIYDGWDTCTWAWTRVQGPRCVDWGRDTWTWAGMRVQRP